MRNCNLLGVSNAYPFLITMPVHFALVVAYPIGKGGCLTSLMDISMLATPLKSLLGRNGYRPFVFFSLLWFLPLILLSTSGVAINNIAAMPHDKSRSTYSCMSR